MAKEFKQRQIKNNNKKYIILSIVIVLAIAILSLIIVLIVKNRPQKVNNDSDNNIAINTQNNLSNVNISKNTVVNIIDKDSEQNNNTENNKLLDINKKLEQVNKDNQNKEQIEEEQVNTKFFGFDDATIDGVKRNMTIKEVTGRIGMPENTKTDKENHGDNSEYTVQKYFYDGGKTQIDLIALYEGDEYVVHRMRTTSDATRLAKGLKIGTTTEEVIAAFEPECILYKSQEQIIVGFKGEDPMYAVSIKPKLYFTIKNNKVVEYLVSLGTEN